MSKSVPVSPSFAKIRTISKEKSETIVLRGTHGNPDKVFQVADKQIPEDLKGPLLEPFSEFECQEIDKQTDLHVAEIGHDVPKALWLFGPPAVGKTTTASSISADIFDREANAVCIDGDIFRSVHRGFQMVVQHGLRNGLVHAEAWPMFKKAGIMDQMKVSLVDKAIANRQHIIIPEAGLSRKRVLSVIDKLSAAGYAMHAMCLWAPKSETLRRGRTRSVNNGKVFSVVNYEKSNSGAVCFGELWEGKIAAGDKHFVSVKYFDNTICPCRLVSAAEFHRMTAMSDDEATRHTFACLAAKKVADDAARVATCEVLECLSRENSKAAADFSDSEADDTESQANPWDSQVSLDSQATWFSHSDLRDAARLWWERQTGRIEGLLLGVGAFVVLAVTSVVASRWRRSLH